MTKTLGARFWDGKASEMGREICLEVEGFFQWFFGGWFLGFWWVY